MGFRDKPLDATIHVVTPENIAFEYRLAGPFRRLPALLLDYCIRGVVQVGIMIGLGLTLGFVSMGLAVFLIMLIWFVIEWFYGALFETFLNGQTPGKYLLGLRVLSDNGRPIDGMQATLRNLLRVADMFGAVGLIAMLMNSKYKRLGDLVAGTIVVVEERQWLTGVAKLDDPRSIQLAAYLPPNFVVSRSMAKALATYVERRRYFTPPRRREVARHLAEPLLERFGLPADTSYDLLLCALYYRTFIADRSQDERMLAEAQAAFVAANPFANLGTQIAVQPKYVPPPLVQEQIVGAGFGGGRP
ncbi:MAG TPA: RDD family protein [Pirellulaceae bacterium]|nr:RDD family protein [Pirellulaceae bacterium]